MLKLQIQLLICRYQEDTTRRVLDTILSIQPTEARGGLGETREAVIYRIASEALDKLPADYIAYEVKERLSKLEPMNIFLRQEIDRFQRVLNVVRRTLVELKLAIDGTIVMNEDLRDALDRMYDAKIPTLWLKLSWESSTLGAWFSDLYMRNEQYRSWLKLEKDTRPIAFWMTGFFNPQGFLTAMRQVINILKGLPRKFPLHFRKLHELIQVGHWTTSCSPIKSLAWIVTR